MIQIKKTILTLVALLAVTTGAWADETLLLTINSRDYTSFTDGSKTFDDKVTVTFSNEVSNYGDAAGWYGGGTASLLTVAGINGYTITSCKFYVEVEGIPMTGYTVEGKSPSVYLYGKNVFTDANQSVLIGTKGITKIEVYGTAPGVATATPVDGFVWNGATKTGTFTMPGGNVTLEPEYYPQAALTAAPTAINDVPATTDGAIVKAGTVANIGSSETAQGTVMYYVSQTALDDAALLALAADQWTADVPTAKSLAEGKAYVYYYVRGNDSDTDEENFSDGDILSANALTVTIAAEPTYAVTFAEGTDPNEWTASPKVDVKKGQTVTVTYTGSKKVIGVKAEKKGEAVAVRPLAEAVAADLGKIAGADGNIYDTKAAAEAAGTTAVAMIAYVGSDTGNDTYTHGMALALSDEGEMNWSNAKSTCEGKSAVSGAAWLLPSRNQWKAMFKANGGNEGSYTGLNTAVATAGGDSSKLQKNERYWSSSEQGSNFAWVLVLGEDNAGWDGAPEDLGHHVRACLAF